MIIIKAMLALDYNTIIKHQYEVVTASRKNFHRLTRFNIFNLLKRKLITRLNDGLSNQLIHARGLVSEFTDRFKEVEEIDLNFLIELIDKLIKLNISLKSEFENSNDPDLKKANDILTETIEHYYTSLRILKRHNKRESIPTSQMAIDSCRHSLNTLQAVINSRRST
jgi:hypothetical protein